MIPTRSIWVSDCGNVALVDGGRRGVAIGIMDDATVDDLVFPAEIVRHERVGAHAGKNVSTSRQDDSVIAA
jgi:hypothetical protein